MKRLPALIAGLCCAVTALAVRGQNPQRCSDEEFRTLARAVVSEGNREYDRSRRHGIAAMADSLERIITLRSGAGRLNGTDSLEFTADLLKLRGDFHYENGAYDDASFAEAERYFIRALDIYTSNRGFYGHLQYAPLIHRELAQLCYRTEAYDRASEHTLTALGAYETAFDNGEFESGDSEYETLLDLRSQAALCRARTGDFVTALKIIDEVAEAYPADGGSRREALRKKAKILMLAGDCGREGEAAALYKEYLQWSRDDALDRFADMTADDREGWWMRMRPFFADCYRLESADPAFLYDVTLFSKGLLLQLNRMSGRGRTGIAALNSLRHTWRDIQNRLADDDCAVEFVQYETQGENRMAALVLRKTGAPQWVAMMSATEFEAWSTGGRSNGERLGSASGEAKNAMFGDSLLRVKVWNGELCRAVEGCRRIYFAPDGYLHRLPVEYMTPEELYGVGVFRLTSTRRLMEDARVRSDAALVMGGIKYNSREPEDMTEGNDAEACDYMRRAGAGFDFLPFSLMESDSVYALRNCLRDTLLTGSAATESAFRRLCGRYPIVNISTHGCFGAAGIPQGSDLKPCMSDESLSQSVIALAGVNLSLADGSFDGSGADGLLSAREIAGLDMSEVDLAVVSACQTGLGYVTADGIYGLERGLKNAGVGCLLVSLWNVDDRATCRLVTEFHRNLRSGMTVHEAFVSARGALAASGGTSPRRRVFNPATLASEYVAGEDDFSKPQYCNAFVLIDATE